jgi:hypothetical protein
MSYAGMNGKSIAIDIKERCRLVEKRIYKILEEAGVSIDSYKKWRAGHIEPRVRTVKKVDEVLKKYEAQAGIKKQCG